VIYWVQNVYDIDCGHVPQAAAAEYNKCVLNILCVN